MSIVSAWEEAISKIKSTGSWFCSGENLNLPIMSVFDKSLQFPISTDDCRGIFKSGRLTENMDVELDYQKTMQIDAGSIQFHSTWDLVLKRITNELNNAFIVETSLLFDKMLVYYEGCQSKDQKITTSDKTNHISNLFISLPTQSGLEGEFLQVYSPDRCLTLPWDGNCNGNSASWCNFFTDCDHVLMPNLIGHRIVLHYQVYKEEEKKKEDKEEVEEDIQPFKLNKSNEEGACSGIQLPSLNIPPPPSHSVVEIVKNALIIQPTVYILLTHKYNNGKKIIDPSLLKGADRMLYEILKKGFGCQNATVTCCKVRECMTYFEKNCRTMSFRKSSIFRKKIDFDMTPQPQQPPIHSNWTYSLKPKLKRLDPINLDGLKRENEKDESDDSDDSDDDYDDDDDDDDDDEKSYPEFPCLYFFHPSAVFLFSTKDMYCLGYDRREADECFSHEFEYNFSFFCVRDVQMKKA